MRLQSLVAPQGGDHISVWLFKAKKHGPIRLWDESLRVATQFYSKLLPRYERHHALFL